MHNRLLDIMVMIARSNGDLVGPFDRAYLDALGKDPDGATHEESAKAKAMAICAIVGARHDSLGEWAKRVSGLANRKGFRDGVANPTGIEALGTYTANLHSEVSELWEAARDGKLNEPCDKADAMRAVGIEPLTCAEEWLLEMAP